MTLDSFFSIWSQFLDDCKVYWKMEQEKKAREMFETLQKRRKVKISRSEVKQMCSRIAIRMIKVCMSLQKSKI